MGKEEIGDVIISNSTRYWIYTVQDKSWKRFFDLFNEDKLYLTTFKNADVKANDIIIVYQKGSGFTAILQTESNLKENIDGIKIFNDKTVNKFIIKLETISMMQDSFKLKMILPTIKRDPNFKSVINFSGKYAKGDMLFNQLPLSLGKLIVKSLYDISDKYDEEQSTKSSKNSKGSSKSSKSSSKSNKSKKSIDLSKQKLNTEDFTIIDNSKKPKKINKPKKPPRSKIANIGPRFVVEDEEDNDDNDDNDAIDSYDCSKSNSSKDSNGKVHKMVPILFMPCKKFKWEDEFKKDSDFLDQFKRHYTKCSKCKSNNNGNKDIGGILDTADLDYELACEDDTGFEGLLKAYHLAEPYVTDDDVEEDTIILYLIDDYGNDYDKCILIEWICV